MKFKIAAFFVLATLLFSSCMKKQCPAYGQHIEKNAEHETVKA
ncbi:hypothetical protein [Marinilongibacter aquaticus]|nr:hypothetical protein [Marinilongibacter aquaticus]